MISRVLIVGAGSIGKRHLRLARDLLPKADIRVLRHRAGSPVPESANGVFFGMEEAVAFAPQIAVIANPATFHIDIAQTLAEAGVHLLVEKPLSGCLKGVAQLLDTCRRTHTILQVGYNLRFLVSLQHFRDLLGQGVIGRTLSVRCEIGQYLPSWRPDSDYRQGVSARRELGGGALSELSHELDYLRWIFGEIVWVKATLGRQSSLELDVEDTVHMTLGFVPSADGHQLIGAVNLDFIRHDATRYCAAIGENGSLRWNGLTGTVELYEPGAIDWRTLFHQPHRGDDSYLAEWRNFLECVNGQEAPLISGEDGLQALQIIEAARASAASGCQQPVNKLGQASS